MKRSSITGYVAGPGAGGGSKPLPAPLSESGSLALTLEEGEELRVSVGSGRGYAVYLIPRADLEDVTESFLSGLGYPDHEPGKVHVPDGTPVEIGE